MSEPADPVEPRIEEYWSWVAVALYLLVPLDLLTTMFAAKAVGVGAEANPLMRWLLAQSVPAIVAVNVVVVVLAAVFFHALMLMLRRSPAAHRRYFAAGVEAWLGGLVAAGLLVFANNLSVIVLGRALVG